MNKISMLMKGALGRKVPAEFAAENYDYNAALLDEMQKLFCDEKGRFSRKMYNRNKLDVFDLIAENIDEILPQKVMAALDMFCEVKTFPNGSRPEFRVIRGRQRGKQFVTRVTEAGDYEAFRLDRDHFSVYPQAIGGAAYVDFERYLEGVEDMAILVDILQEGMIDRIYGMVQELLLQSWNLAGRPARNKVAVSTFDSAAMVNLVNTVAPYGSPVIYCTPEFAAEMTNEIVYKTANAGAVLPEADKNDIRERGYIGVFRGTPVVLMPQSWTDENNEKLAMNPSFAYVIPTGREKLIKVCFEGETMVKEVENDGDWSSLIKMYRKVGLGMVSTPNYWGIYYNAGINAEGWEDYNASLNIEVDNP